MLSLSLLLLLLSPYVYFVLVCMCVCECAVQVWERSNICAHQNRNRLHLIELKINSICIQTFGISETCNKSMSTNTMPSVRAIFMDKSNCNPIVKPSHFVYLNCVWLKIVNSVLSIWSEVFCKQKKTNCPFSMSAIVNIWFNDNSDKNQQICEKV